MSGLAASLFFVFAIAKAATLWGRALPLSPWTPLAYAWQDAAVALGFFVFARLARREWIARGAYGALVLLVAINVPVARVLGSPLTAPMIRAARGTLVDSISYHVTLETVSSIALVVAAGVLLPLLWRPPIRTVRMLVIAGATTVVLGPFAAQRVDSAGLERNPVVAIVRTSFARVRANAMDAEWRRSPFGRESESVDLGRMRGLAAGRNVLLIVLESTAAHYLRPWGAVEDPMPNLTSLAARSVVFDHAYAVYPESIKGLVAILSSRYPAFDVSAERHAGVMVPSLATAIRSAGYETALFHSGRFMYLGMERVLGTSGFARMEDAGNIGGNRNSSFGIDEPAAVQRLLQWVDSLPRGARFFATYLPIAGHHPYAYSAPGPFAAGAEIGRYRNALHEGDLALGELFAGLRARDAEKNTLVVVMADHGEAFGQHPGNYGHNLALYDENVRVPLMVFVPGARDAALHIDRAASLLDVAPTVLDLLGLERPREFQGESLLAARERMALFFTDYSLGLFGLRDGCTKFITELESGRSKLFDLCRDPDEQLDLAAERAERSTPYRALLHAWSAAQVARIERVTRLERAAIVSGGRFR